MIDFNRMPFGGILLNEWIEYLLDKKNFCNISKVDKIDIECFVTATGWMKQTKERETKKETKREVER